MNIELVTFAEILVMAFEGATVARKAWDNSSKKDVVYVHVRKDGIPKLHMQYNDGSNDSWLPKQKDIFAADWYVVQNQSNK